MGIEDIEGSIWLSFEQIITRIFNECLSNSLLEGIRKLFHAFVASGISSPWYLIGSVFPYMWWGCHIKESNKAFKWIWKKPREIMTKVHPKRGRKSSELEQRTRFPETRLWGAPNKSDKKYIRLHASKLWKFHQYEIDVTRPPRPI